MSSFTDEILSIIQKAEAAAYERGWADGHERGKSEVASDLLKMLTTVMASNEAPGVAVEAMAEVKEDVTDSKRERRRAPSSIEDRLRAPRGIVPALVKRVLADGRGYFPKDILENAATDFERMVKAASIRSELNAGKEHGVYRTEDGKWFLSSEAEGVTSSKTAPPASIFE